MGHYQHEPVDRLKAFTDRWEKMLSATTAYKRGEASQEQVSAVVEDCMNQKRLDDERMENYIRHKAKEYLGTDEFLSYNCKKKDKAGKKSSAPVDPLLEAEKEKKMEKELLRMDRALESFMSMEEAQELAQSPSDPTVTHTS